MNGRMSAPAGRGLASGGKNKILKFPEGFLWGAATSAHQVEGGNKNDWSEWEKKNAECLASEAKNKWQAWQQKKFPEMFDPENYISGRACDHYNRYGEDFDIAKSLGMNAFRISIEWSRIEPEEGKFDEQKIEHYRKVLKAIRVRGMEPFVTLWHFTNPLWLEKMGGVECKKFPFYFSRYAEHVAINFRGLIDYWTTFNEPTVIILKAYLRQEWPPAKKNIFSVVKIYKRFSEAHRKAYEKIHKISKNNKVGMVSAMSCLETDNKKSPLDKVSVIVANYFSNNKMLKLVKEKSDFLGVNYYRRMRIKFPLILKEYSGEATDLGWGMNSEGIYNILKDLKKYITENGLADAKDEKREKFIKDHLCWVHKAIQEGADVRGYFHWSFLDNFEWDKGFWPRFGLVEMDYKTMERKIRPSALGYKKICENNYLET